MNKFIDLIGKTPLIKLTSLTNKGSAQLYAKCEFMNPSFSMKDRIAKYILEKADATNQLNPSSTIICSSSGNIGCSVAMLGSIKGYPVIIVVSNKCSIEKQNHIKSFNAKLIVRDEHDYVEYGKKLGQDNGYFDINQYDNPYNPETYYKTLGPEIWKETNGKITNFVMTGSTFGCISGTAKFLVVLAN
jgi:cysteine synthase